MWKKQYAEICTHERFYLMHVVKERSDWDVLEKVVESGNLWFEENEKGQIVWVVKYKDTGVITRQFKPKKFYEECDFFELSTVRRYPWLQPLVDAGRVKPQYWFARDGKDAGVWVLDEQWPDFHWRVKDPTIERVINTLPSKWHPCYEREYGITEEDLFWRICQPVWRVARQLDAFCKKSGFITLMTNILGKHYEWDVRMDTVDSHIDIAHYWPLQWDNTYEAKLTREEFAIVRSVVDKVIPEQVAVHLLKAVEAGQLQLVQVGIRKYWELEDIRGRVKIFYLIEKLPQRFHELMHFEIDRKELDISYEQHFIEYRLLQRPDAELIQEMLDEGLLQVVLVSDKKVPKLRIHREGYWWPIAPQELPATREGYIEFIPKRNVVSVGCTTDEFYMLFVLSQREDFEVLKQLHDEERLTIVSIERMIYADVVVDEGESTRHVLIELRDLPVKKTAEELLEFVSEYGRHGGGSFIMPYQEARELFKEVYMQYEYTMIDQPLDEELLEKLIKENAAVTWVLQRRVDRQVVYVGEVRDIALEEDLLQLYMKEDMFGLVQRRRRLGWETQVVEEIFELSGEKGFEVHIRLVAEQGDVQAVRCIESVIDMEANDGNGALICQNVRQGYK